MADPFVSFVVERIGDLLIQEAQFLNGVSDQVQNLQTELRRMQCFLKDADSKASNGDERVRNWVAEIRDLAYDAEDVIETYALEVASQRRRERIMNVLKRHKVGSEIKAITAKISNLTRSLQTYGIVRIENESSSSADQSRQQLRRTVSHVVERNVVGRDESIKELVKHMVENEKNCPIVSICGMGGLGKTTLARKVYHHGEVRGRFDYFAWSCISQQFKARDVLEGILIKFNEQREEIAKLRDEELEKKLYQVLQEKRCLMVLDDIWSTEAWDSLRNAFPDEMTNSKILLTTRNQDVALHADSKGFHYKPRCLDEEESWELLQKIAIPQEDDADKRIEELGKEMVKHCGGLPLAITVLGGILATKYSSNEWHTVHETIKSCLRRGKGHGQEQLGVSEVLALSYNNLPFELKPCFLYFSHFPEDYEIYDDKLIQLWVAEGFIKSKQHSRDEGEETVEDVAERYLNELVTRCMVLVGERDASLKIATCRMHDLMRDLCLSKAEEENFFRIVDCRNGDENVDSFPSSTSGKIRRLVLYHGQSCSEGLFLKPIKIPHLRSLLCTFEYDNKPYKVSEMSVFNNYVFNNLKLLRVLDVKGLKLPKDIGKFFHLRYLSLNGSVWGLPSSLGNLRNLQTLNLLRIRGRIHVPNVLWKMGGLRHLYLPKWCDDKTKLQLGNLRSLQTLVNFSFKNFDINELLNNMANLRVLKILDLYLVRDFGETFKSRGIKLLHLRSLHLEICDMVDIYSNEIVVRERIDVASFVSSCTNLYELDTRRAPIEKLPDQLPASITLIYLSDTQLKEDPMITLEKLPRLNTLTFAAEAFMGKQLFCSGQGFPQLYSLCLESLRNLEEWRVDEGALPNLCHLEIENCENLKRLPDGLRFVKTLKELEIRWMPEEFKEKLVEGGEDFYKVQHVPSVIFKNYLWVDE